MGGYGTLLLRVTLGAIFIMHAYLAVAIISPASIIAFQQTKGIPFPQLVTWYTILAHGIGGLCLVLGLLARWAALANVPVAAGSLYFFHLREGFFMGPQGGYEYPLLVLAATIALALTGPGNFTLKK
ncbi:MAG TPA: DoxX family protein [Methylomirabilota bacterium]|nr:DoxX family protein [Methylomirabilota bacterium]